MNKFKDIVRLQCALWLLLASGTAAAQSLLPYQYDSDFLSADFHRGRRQALRETMPDSSVAVLFTAPVRNRANDVNYVYHQDPDFYYLTGFRDADAVLFIFKNPCRLADGSSTNELLLIREPKASRELWTGRMATASEIAALSGISTVRYTSEEKEMEFPYSNFALVMHQRLPQGATNDRQDEYEVYDLLERFKELTSDKSINMDDYKLEKSLAKLREIKTPEEMVLLRKAVNISVDGHLEMMRMVEPGFMEYQVEATGEYTFHYHGAEDIGYPSICGGGENGCVLHYEKNRRPLNAGDLILLDMGAEYHGYTADITRTLPVSGGFTAEQRAIYEIVLRAQDAGIKACKAGNAFREPHNAAYREVAAGLMELGLITSEKQAKQYFPHSTSHYLGLDVHDPGSYGVLEPNHVITVEPGIYIPPGSSCDKKWWNIGIRIEDDILITKDQPENLSGRLPRDPEVLEKLITNAKNRAVDQK
ncbi:MAG: hypothetical protein RIQ47_103 [Bacteroidota bacterium]|jgi:Xaa-Pro aminopeptidase